MTEYRLITFSQKTEKYFLPEAGSVSSLTVNFAGSIPELAEHMDGWEPVSFQLVPNGELTYLSILIKTEAAPPVID